MWKDRYVKEEEYLYYLEYKTTKKFGNVTVNLIVNFYDGVNGIVYLSSGRKRKDLSKFEAKQAKNNCGVELLLWVKEELLILPDILKKHKTVKSLLVMPSDSRRMRIYKRGLLKHGYYVVQVQGLGRGLMLRLK